MNKLEKKIAKELNDNIKNPYVWNAENYTVEKDFRKGERTKKFVPALISTVLSFVVIYILGGIIIHTAFLKDSGPARFNPDDAVVIMTADNTAAIEKSEPVTTDEPLPEYSEEPTKVVNIDMDGDGENEEIEIYFSNYRDKLFVKTIIAGKESTKEFSITYSFFITEVFALSLEQSSKNAVGVMFDAGGTGAGYGVFCAFAYIDGEIKLLTVPGKIRMESEVQEFFGYNADIRFEDDYKISLKCEETGYTGYVDIDNFLYEEYYDDNGKLKGGSSPGNIDSMCRAEKVTDGNSSYVKFIQYIWMVGHAIGEGFLETTFTWDSDLNLKIIEQKVTPESSTESRPDYMKDPKTIDPVVALKLREDYRQHLIDLYGENYKDEFTLEKIWVQQYFGNYNDCEVVYMGCNLSYTEEARSVEVAGYIVVFPSGQEVYAYKNSKFYTIKEAYDTDLITKENVYEIGKQVGIGLTEEYPDP